ncbi:MAG: hypothetical protein ACK5FE_14295 [Cyanobacteriota bacterium]|jgi:hypothetical protein
MKENVVYTYYEDIGSDLGPLLDFWADTWARNGWTPVVLGPEDALKHPMYEKFVNHCSSLPTVNNPKYELACYLRWLAFASAGGGLMVDNDVMNHSYSPSRLEDGRGVLILDSGRVPCALMASDTQSILDEILAADSTQAGLEFGKPHMSDMTILMASHFPNSQNCVCFGSPGWEAAELVHYSTHSLIVCAGIPSPAKKRLA